MTPLKDAIAAAIDRLGDDLETLSRRIHDNPELGYQEVKAAGWLAEFLSAQGFKVERGVAGVETAFRATLETGDGPDDRHHVRIRRAARRSATPAATTSSPPPAPAPAPAWPPRATELPEGADPRRRHPGRGGRRRQGASCSTAASSRTSTRP